MNIKELRIGNYVRGVFDDENEFSEIVKVGCLDSLDITENNNEIYFTDGNHEYYKEIDGIQLTEELILNFGYKKTSKTIGLSVYKILGHTIHCFNNDLFMCNKNGIILKQVHQLQNLYFTLNNEELEQNGNKKGNSYTRTTQQVEARHKRTSD
jgi:hypothetical protein